METFQKTVTLPKNLTMSSQKYSEYCKAGDWSEILVMRCYGDTNIFRIENWLNISLLV